MLIPTFGVRDIAEAVRFYTELLDFRVAFVLNENDPFYVILLRGVDELHLSLHGDRDRFSRSSAIVVCDNVDAVFDTFRARGLSVPIRPESPVHEGPVDQTWGTREVYIDDPSGNTLCFQQR